jgi:hypothetical protein
MTTTDHDRDDLAAAARGAVALEADRLSSQLLGATATSSPVPPPRQVLEQLERELRAARVLLVSSGLHGMTGPARLEVLEALGLAHDQVDHALQLLPAVVPVQTPVHDSRAAVDKL